MKERWDKQLRKDIHVASYWLNPTFQYNQTTFCQKPKVMNGLLEVIDTKVIGVSTRKMMEETTLFWERRNTFGRKMALDCSTSMRPDEWWHMFGHDTPNLKKLAIQLLSQTSASFGLHNRRCEYDPIDYECIDKIEFWVVEVDSSPEIEIDELEEALFHEENQVGGSSSNTFNEVNGDEDGLDLSTFVGIVKGSEGGDNEDDN